MRLINPNSDVYIGLWVHRDGLRQKGNDSKRKSKDYGKFCDFCSRDVIERPEWCSNTLDVRTKFMWFEQVNCSNGLCRVRTSLAENGLY